MTLVGNWHEHHHLYADLWGQRITGGPYAGDYAYLGSFASQGGIDIIRITDPGHSVLLRWKKAEASTRTFRLDLHHRCELTPPSFGTSTNAFVRRSCGGGDSARRPARRPSGILRSGDAIKWPSLGRCSWILGPAATLPA